MRSVIIVTAVACFVAAVAITGAGVRLETPRPGLSAVAPPPRPAEATAPAATGPAPVATPPVPPAPPAAAAPAGASGPDATAPEALLAQADGDGPRTDARLQAAFDALAREQAADRALVAELRSTVDTLRAELARRPTEAPGARPAEETLAVLGDAHFPAGSTAVARGAAAAVRQLVPGILADPALLVSVEGHTDAVPIRTPETKPFKDNADLSLLRARSVADILAAEGVARERIRIRGWGDARPRASNATEAGRSANRRVEVRLVRPPRSP